MKRALVYITLQSKIVKAMRNVDFCAWCISCTHGVFCMCMILPVPV